MWLSYPILFRYWNNRITPVGLPHSAIAGSQDMCSFPALFAAYHGLLRLVAPRHPPYTSIRLTILSFYLQNQCLPVVQARRAGIVRLPLRSVSASRFKDYFCNFHNNSRIASFIVVSFPSLVVSNIACSPDFAFRDFIRAFFNGLVRSSSWA